MYGTDREATPGRTIEGLDHTDHGGKSMAAME